jgi:glutamyl-tRNA reductase
MAAAAVRLAGQLFEDLGTSARAVRGRGRNDRAGGHALRGQEPKAIAVANRTLERGEKLAGRFGGEAMRLADLPARLPSSTWW